MPGEMSPEDVKRFVGDNNLARALRKLFLTDQFAIDWWEGDPRVGEYEYDQGYYVRPKIVGIQGLYHAGWGGPCTFLSNVGCTLDEDKRPSTCLMLEPTPSHECILHGAGKRQCAIDWLPYTQILKEIAEGIQEEPH
jgi:hypothetical protein